MAHSMLVVEDPFEIVMGGMVAINTGGLKKNTVQVAVR